MKAVKKILINKDYRALIENLLSLGFLQLANLLLPLLVLPYVIKTIGFDCYGQIVVASSLVMYFQSLVDYSFTITATRDVANHRESKQELDFIFSKVMTVKMLFLTVSFFIISLLTLLVPVFSDYKVIVFFSMLILVGKFLFPDWYFQGIEKMKYITIINIFIKILFTLSIFILVKEKKDYWIYPLINSLSYIFAGIIALYVVLVQHKINFIMLKPLEIKQAIKDNFPIFLSQFMPTLYNNSSSLIVGILVSTSSAGLFDTLKKIVDLVNMVLSVISKVCFPFLNRKHNFFTVYRNVVLFLTVLMIVFLLIFSKYIFIYFSIVDEESTKLLSILVFGVIGFSLYNIFSTNYLVIHKQDKDVMKNTVYASLIGFVLSFPLVYYFEILGGAISLSLSRLLLGLGALYLYYKFKRAIYENSNTQKSR